MTETFRGAGISDEEIIDLLRTLGRGLSQAAESMRALTMRLVLEPGVSEHELAQRYAYAASQLSPMLGPLVTNLLTLHLREMAQSEALSRRRALRWTTRRLARDRRLLRRPRRLHPPRRGATARRARAQGGPSGDAHQRSDRRARAPDQDDRRRRDAHRARARAAARRRAHPARCRRGRGRGLPPAARRHRDRTGALARRGLVRAPRQSRQPDHSIARPGSLLAEREVRESTRDAYRWSYAGERRLRGIREAVPLFRARRLAEREP